jgi:homogentisate 1,2-dioxygenase
MQWPAVIIKLCHHNGKVIKQVQVEFDISKLELEMVKWLSATVDFAALMVKEGGAALLISTQPGHISSNFLSTNDCGGFDRAQE